MLSAIRGPAQVQKWPFSKSIFVMIFSFLKHPRDHKNPFLHSTHLNGPLYTLHKVLSTIRGVAQVQKWPFSKSIFVGLEPLNAEFTPCWGILPPSRPPPRFPITNVLSSHQDTFETHFVLNSDLISCIVAYFCSHVNNLSY